MPRCDTADQTPYHTPIAQTPSRTADNVQRCLGDKGEHVHPLSVRPLQLLHQHPCLLVEHIHELIEDGEVEGGRQHLAPLVPLGACERRVG